MIDVCFFDMAVWPGLCAKILIIWGTSSFSPVGCWLYFSKYKAVRWSSQQQEHLCIFWILGMSIPAQLWFTDITSPNYLTTDSLKLYSWYISCCITDKCKEKKLKNPISTSENIWSQNSKYCLCCETSTDKASTTWDESNIENKCNIA